MGGAPDRRTRGQPVRHLPQGSSLADRRGERDETDYPRAECRPRPARHGVVLGRRRRSVRTARCRTRRKLRNHRPRRRRGPRGSRQPDRGRAPGDQLWQEPTRRRGASNPLQLTSIAARRWPRQAPSLCHAALQTRGSEGVRAGESEQPQRDRALPEWNCAAPISDRARLRSERSRAPAPNCPS
jgi:hypothetical protein